MRCRRRRRCRRRTRHGALRPGPGVRLVSRLGLGLRPQLGHRLRLRLWLRLSLRPRLRRGSEPAPGLTLLVALASACVSAVGKLGFAAVVVAVAVSTSIHAALLGIATLAVAIVRGGLAVGILHVPVVLRELAVGIGCADPRASIRLRVGIHSCLLLLLLLFSRRHILGACLAKATVVGRPVVTVGPRPVGLGAIPGLAIRRGPKPHSLASFRAGAGASDAERPVCDAAHSYGSDSVCDRGRRRGKHTWRRRQPQRRPRGGRRRHRRRSGGQSRALRWRRRRRRPRRKRWQW
jgi:hypothetical protein